ncbi:AzlD domain-containing protein [Arcobacter sp. CECT 8985]|uniref:AzlD domain-containing protein n=1 Tax=Arcobacter sp. CECT 8985 TaxID=1935424 RepID=UPI00100C1EB0|nr:AzlD domain-containing protein [Arcobacter sp. CECT 8985]RXJ84838.1 branched-chain amino acid ABC transporter [Arcobacter sp. CECT 8985]
MNNTNILIIIFFVGLGTYFLRLSGLLLSSRLKKIKYIDLFLEGLPPTLLISLIVPSIIKVGTIGIIAALVTIILMYKTKNSFLAMSIAVLLVALNRNGLLL